MKKNNMKKPVFLSLVACFVITHCFLCRDLCSGQYISEEYLRGRYKQFRPICEDKTGRGYDLIEVDRLITDGERAKQQGDLPTANRLLNQAFAMLHSMGGKQTPSPSERPAQAIFKECPFGVAFGELYKGETFMPYIKELGVRCTKLYLHWHWIEPQNNKYDWHLVDRFLSQLKDGDEALIAIFTSSPWGAHGVGKGYPPKDYQEYYNFIYDLVKHCKGKIKYWQRDTEPASPIHWDKDKTKDYVLTQKHFYNAVKAADPRALVIDVSHNGVFRHGEPQNRAFFEYVLEHGRDYFDILDIRLYWDLYEIPYRVNWMRDAMKKNGYQKPIVSTEYGGPTPVEFPEYKGVKRKLAKLTGYDLQDRKRLKSGLHKLYEELEGLPPSMRMFMKNAPTELEQKRHRLNCKDIVQRSVIALSVGVEKLWYWNLMSRRHPRLGPHPIFGKLRLMDEHFKNRYPAFYAYQRMVDKLKDIHSIEKITTQNDDIHLFEIHKKSGKEIYVLWEKRDLLRGEDQPATSFRLALSWGKARMTDVFGNQQIKEIKNGNILIEVTDTPIFLEPMSLN